MLIAAMLVTSILVATFTTGALARNDARRDPLFFMLVGALVGASTAMVFIAVIVMVEVF
jgi:hypothetical protein